ncbi:UNKNOWN [Stylonychia lemnae]|uniref:Ribonuclease P/MRP protein subunit POP5 n=1 Tax=Stylonychia lemnae TaxID=5949 RepID=A0A078AD55_STYLE|nr:UNKNOWN [Stylonychia lemnae]|eukprot:CDW80170.1 UNKNOWN [Stylonychia lemnae]
MVRIKQRYILGEIQFNQQGFVDPSTFNQKSLIEAFREAVKDCYGDLGLAKIQSNFIGRENEQMAVTSLIMITKLYQHESKIRTLHVGGTLEKVEKALKNMTESWIENQTKKNQATSITTK